MKYKRPLLLLGQGAKGSNYRSFIKKYNIPTITSRLGIDLLEYDHPLFVGHPGNYGDVSSKKAIENADYIMVVGCRLASALVGYTPEDWGKQAFKEVVEIDGKEINKPGVKIDKRVMVDAKQYFNTKIPEIDDTSNWVEQCRKWKEENKFVTNRDSLNSYNFIDYLSHYANEKDIILVDTGSCFHTVAQAWKIKKGQRYITTGGLSSMGWWAASIGAGMVGRTICITGDGSFQMNIQELATIVHNRLPVKVFVFNNDGYGLIRATQRRFMDKRYIGESPKSGISFPNLGLIAKAYGINFVKIEDIRMMEGQIRGIMLDKSNKYPTLCEVKLPKWEKIIRPND